MAQRYQSNPWVIGVDLRNEPRSPATWGGAASTDWHAAAERGGNAVLTVNPNLLIFVEGVNYAGDLSGVATLPVQLNVANQLVYEAHDYGFWYSSIAGYSGWYNSIEPKWGYLVNGSNPQPLWIGEFGTCNSADTCDSSGSDSRPRLLVHRHDELCPRLRRGLVVLGHQRHHGNWQRRRLRNGRGLWCSQPHLERQRPAVAHVAPANHDDAG